MAAGLVTLTTDFGYNSPYVGAMKGALLAINPAVNLVDLSHGLPPQDLRACSVFLRTALPFFPPASFHVVVVDPGVGTERALLYVETGELRLLVPDNGCWTELARQAAGPPKVVVLTERRWWRPEVSATFHGRDVLAPVAGHLTLGVPPNQLGPPAVTWTEFTLPVPRLTADTMEGEVLFVDDFGNLLTNLPGEVYASCRQRVTEVWVGKRAVTCQVRSYGEASAGDVVVLVSSAGTVEVAEVNGHAARRLGAAAGTPVRIRLRD